MRRSRSMERNVSEWESTSLPMEAGLGARSEEVRAFFVGGTCSGFAGLWTLRFLMGLLGGAIVARSAPRPPATVARFASVPTAASIAAP